MVIVLKKVKKIWKSEYNVERKSQIIWAYASVRF